MKTLLFILTLFVSFKGYAEVFPITLNNGFIVTEAVIEGRSVLVILDSGAPGLVLNQKYYQGIQDSVVSCSGIYGEFECRSHVVKKWEWLGITGRNTTALVSDLSFLENLLKQNGLQFTKPASWAEQARLAADGKMDELKALQEKLTGGR